MFVVLVFTWVQGVRHLQFHQCFDVINPRCFPICVCGAKSFLHQVLLLPLDLHHALLHWIFHNELQQQTHTKLNYRYKLHKSVQIHIFESSWFKLKSKLCTKLLLQHLKQHYKHIQSPGFLTFVTMTFLFCPRRWQRSIHCSSVAGFHAWNTYN